MLNRDKSSAAHFIVVNYNSGDWLQKSIASILQHTDSSISVVDNASNDLSFSLAKENIQDQRINWIANQNNLGFAVANNQVLQELLESTDAQKQYAVCMNPDCEIKADSLQTILAVMDNDQSIGLASCRIVDQHGHIQASCRRRFPTPKSALVRMLGLSKLFQGSDSYQDFDYGDGSKSTDPNEVVEAISGAFMVVRVAALKAVGLLDPAYFMHCEDLDWCKRFAENDYKVVFVPSAEIIHAKGVSSRSRPVGVLWTLHKGMHRFYQKFYRQQTNVLIYSLVVLGIYLSFAPRALKAWLSK